MGDIVVFKWLSSPSGRSKRSQDVQEGCFMLEHDATGRFYVGESAHVSKEVDKQLQQLMIRKHPCKLLNGLYDKDPAVRVFEYPARSKAARKSLLKDLRASGSVDYLCLNK